MTQTEQSYPQHVTDILNRMPSVRGRVSANVVLADVTWFGVGGPADVVFKPEDAEDLAYFLANKPTDIPAYVVGVGSNLLVRDGGIRGVVIRLGRAFTEITVDGDIITAGAAALDTSVARVAQQAGLEGMEFLCGIPGTIGGAMVMNAGAYGSEVKDILVRAEILSPDGTLHHLTADELKMGYRTGNVPGDWVVVRLVLRGKPGSKEQIANRMDAIRTSRAESQPLKTRTGGSTFRNPPGESAWKLIDLAGCRGLTRGGAQVSEKHCNFLINTGTATAADIEELGEEVRRRVKETTGIDLHWEIRRMGVPASDAKDTMS